MHTFAAVLAVIIGAFFFYAVPPWTPGGVIALYGKPEMAKSVTATAPVAVPAVVQPKGPIIREVPQ